MAIIYLVLACLLFFLRRRDEVRPMAMLGIGVDIAASLLAMHALPSAASGIAMMLLFNVGAAALLLPLRVSLGVAALAGFGLVADYAWAILAGHGAGRPLAEVLMFSVSYLAIATLTSIVGRQMRASQALAEERGSKVANMARWPPPRRNWLAACIAGSTMATANPPRCNSPPTCRRCCRASPGCWPAAIRCWYSWTMPRSRPVARNR